MGIEKFDDLLKQNCPHAFETVPLQFFTGQRIAIDFNFHAWRMYTLAVRVIVDKTNLVTEQVDLLAIENFAIEKMFEMLAIFARYKIIPVCVLDSTPHPLKNHARDKKAKEREKKMAKLQQAQIDLLNYDPLLVTTAVTKAYADELKKSFKPQESYYCRMTDILRAISIPVFTAAQFGFMSNDAEGICAALCMPGNNYCVATYTKDGDYHCYGGNLAIYEIEGKMVQGEYRHFATVRSLTNILTDLQMPFPVFLDLCICLGTDFNDNMNQVGVVRALELIRRFGSIDNIAASGRDVSVLNHHAVRQMFRSVSFEIRGIDCNINQLLKSNLTNVFAQANLTKYIYAFQILASLLN